MKKKMNGGLDLSKFKKVSSDGSTTTLMHPEGHKIVLAHTALHPKMREQLAAIPLMAEGGSVQASPTPKDDIPEPDPKKAKEFVNGATAPGTTFSQGVENIKKELGFAKGGKVPHYADGTPDAPVQASDSQPDVAPQTPININIGGGQPSLPASMLNPNAGQMIANANPVQVQTPTQQLMHNPPYGMTAEQIAQMADSAPSASSDPSITPTNAPQSTNAGSVIPPVGANPTLPPQGVLASNDPFGNQTLYNAYEKGIGEQKAGLSGEAKAEGALGQQQADVAGEQADTLQSAQDTYNKQINDLQSQREGFQKDIQNYHVDPQHYLNTMGVGGKISTAIGLILGGIGGGLTHQENPALKMLNAQIDRDIDGQRMELGKKENLLSANMKQFGNLHDAMDMTRVMQNDIVANQLKEAAGAAQTPIAKFRALQAAGQLDTQSAPILADIARRRTLLTGAQNGHIDPAAVVEFIVPEKDRPTARKELEQAQGMVRAKDNILGAFDQLTKVNTVGNRVSSPLQTSKQVAAIRDPLVAGLSKETAGRFTEQDAKFLSSLFPAAGDSSQTQQMKRSQLVKLITEKMNFPTLKFYGADPTSMGGSRFSQTGQPTIPQSAPVPNKK